MAGSGDGTHRDDHRLGRVALLAVAELGEAVVDVVALGDRTAGAVDANDDGLDVFVLGGLLYLPEGVVGQAFHQHAVNAHNGDLICR